MAMASKQSLLEYTKKGLETDIKKALINRLSHDMMIDVEVQVREVIEGIVDELVIENTETWTDMMSIKEQLHVFLHWKE